MPANTNNDYVMKNDEWSLQVNLKKTDSETGSQIAADAQYEIYQWDVVTGKYQPTGGYNTYSVQRQGDGTYAVINSAAYATTDAMRHTLYYTQRNQGKFILVETKAPAGYLVTGRTSTIPARQVRPWVSAPTISRLRRTMTVPCFGWTMPTTTPTS